MNSFTFHITGMHCPSCKMLLEDIFLEQKYIVSAKVDFKKELVILETNTKFDDAELAETLTQITQSSGYKVMTQKPIPKNNNDNIWIAIPIGIIVLILFFLLQKSGILNFGLGSKVTPVSSFLIGIVASLSSCLAIVGGLILSITAKVSQSYNRSIIKDLSLFHLSRILGFGILGGILGLLGKTISINSAFTSVLGIIAALIMVILGFNLLGTLKSKLTLPSTLFAPFKKHQDHHLAPVILGSGTFFLPCGFTQSMQITALASGNFIAGFLIMFAFALGTLPVLSLLSFSSVSFAHSKYSDLFFKTIGIIVLGLGLFALISSLTGLGIINPLFNL